MLFKALWGGIWGRDPFVIFKTKQGLGVKFYFYLILLLLLYFDICPIVQNECEIFKRFFIWVLLDNQFLIGAHAFNVYYIIFFGLVNIIFRNKWDGSSAFESMFLNNSIYT